MIVVRLAPGSHTRLYTSRTEFNCASPQHLAQNLTPNWHSLFVKWKNGWLYQDPSFFTTLPILAFCVRTCKPSITHRSFLDSGDPVSLFQAPPWLSWDLCSTALNYPNCLTCSSVDSPSSLSSYSSPSGNHLTTPRMTFLLAGWLFFSPSRVVYIHRAWVSNLFKSDLGARVSFVFTTVPSTALGTWFIWQM